jgi:GT2 family glycosyltransferase
MSDLSAVRVAVVIVSWNGLDLLARCLEALAAQTRPFDRVIVVDNGSADLERLPPWAGQGEFRLEALGENLGFAAANNHGFTLCPDCEYVALVNPDAFLAPDWLEQMLVVATRNPAAASFASCLIQANVPEKLDGAGDVYHPSGLAWRAGFGEPVARCGDAVREVFSPCAAAALYRREALMSVGGFDSDFFCYMEDVDLGFRLRLQGWSSLLVPAAKAWHVGSASTGGQRSAFAVYHGHRNLVWCFVKNMPGWLFWLCLPLHLLTNLLTIGLYAWRGQFWNILRAKRDALRGMQAILRKRRHIQSRSKVRCRDIWFALNKSFGA